MAICKIRQHIKSNNKPTSKKEQEIPRSFFAASLPPLLCCGFNLFFSKPSIWLLTLSQPESFSLRVQTRLVGIENPPRETKQVEHALFVVAALSTRYQHH